MATPALLGGGGIKATAPATKPSQTTTTLTPLTKTTQQAAIPKPTPLQQQYPDALPYGMFQGSLMPENQPGLTQYMRDWATQGGSRGVMNQAGTGMVSYGDVLQQMKNAGMNVTSLPQFAAPSAPQNPFANLLNQYNDIYKGVSGNVGSIYNQLGGQLAANRAQYSAETPRLAQQISSQYSNALNDVRGEGVKYQQQLAQLAKGIGLPQTLTDTRATDLGGDLARIAALNATNRAASEANLALRGGAIGDLLLGNQSAAAQQGAAAQAGLATQALNRFGMADPETLLANYMTGVNANQLAALNLDLQNAKAAAAAKAGGGGRGGGRRGGGGGSGGGVSATTSGATSLNPYDAMRQWYAATYGTVPDATLADAYYTGWRKAMPGTMDTRAGLRVNRGQFVGPQ